MTLNTIIPGDCTKIMTSLPSGSIDFVLTDPPYIASYKNRDNQTIRNDGNASWLQPAFAQIHRLLKPDSFAISFYGWHKVDLFFAAWRKAGFRIGGHVVFRKKYASKSAFFRYEHESAYLLVKGNPAFPVSPLPDVMDWTYTGNKLHPTEKHIDNLRPLIETFTKPGEVVLDPFAGSGSTCHAALSCGRRYLGIELDPQHHRTATYRLEIEALELSIRKLKSLYLPHLKAA